VSIGVATLHHTLRASAPVRAKSPNPGNAWLGREDSNLRMAESKSADFRTAARAKLLASRPTAKKGLAFVLKQSMCVDVRAR